MANDKFLNAKKVVDELTASFEAHDKAIANSAASLSVLNTEYKKLPSEYIKSQKEIAELNLKVARAEKAVADALSAAAKVRQQNINAVTAENRQKISSINLSNAEAKARSSAADVAAKAAAKISREKEKEISSQERALQKTIAASEKTIRQKEKEFAKFEKEFNQYEASLKKKEIAEARAAQKQLEFGERLRIQREKEIIALDRREAKRERDAAREAARMQKQLADANKVPAAPKTTPEIVGARILSRNSEREFLSTSQLAGAYRNLSAQVSKASETYQNLIVRGRTAEQTQRQFNREVKNAERIFQVYQKRVLEADKAVDKWQRTGERSIGLLRNLVGAFGVAGGVSLFASFVKDVFEVTKELQSLDKSLKLVSETQAVFAKNTAFLRDISQRYGIEINGLTQMFIQFYVNAKDKISGDAIRDIFDRISKAGASMGLSVSQQERAFLALNQMMSKGTIQAEELRGQLGEALPGAFTIMTNAYNALHKEAVITEADLAKLMKDGKLIASQILPEFARQLEKTYGIENINNIDTLVSKQNRLKNDYTDFIRSMDEDGGIISKFFGFFVAGADDAIKSLTRLNRSWKTLFSMAWDEGGEWGENMFKQRMMNLAGTGSDEEIAASIRTVAVKDLAIYEKNLRWLQKEAEKAGEKVKNTQPILVGTPIYLSRSLTYRNALSDYEDALKQVAAQKGIIAAADKALLPPGKAVNDLTEDGTKKMRQRTKANKDYLISEFEIVKLQLENQIKYSTSIMADEERNFEQRKKASLQLSEFKMQLAELEYKEALRVNKFRLEDDLRIARAERVNAITNKNASTEDILEAERDYLEKVNGINHDARGNELIAYIKFADQKKSIFEESLRHLEKVQREILDLGEVNVVSEQQLEGLRKLMALLEDLGTKSSNADFQKIAKLQLDIAEDFAQKNLDIQIKTASDQLKSINDDNNRRIALEKELGEELNKVSDDGTDERIKNIQEELNSCQYAIDVESKEYKELQATLTKLETERQDNRVRKAEETAQKIREINRTIGNYDSSSNQQTLLSVLNENEKNILEGLIQNLRDGKAGAEEILDEFLAALDAYKQLGTEFNSALTSGEKNKLKEMFDEVAAGTEGADLKLKNYLATLGLMKEYFESFTEDFISNSGFESFFDLMSNKIAGFGEDWRVTFLAITEIAQEFHNLQQQQINANFDIQKERLEAQKELALKMAGESASGRAEIERQYDIKRRKLLREEAKQKKQAALFNAIIDAAQAVVAFLANGNFGGAIAAGIMGAVQIGIISAQQIPEYKEGLKAGSHPGGPMIVNDGPGANYKETIVKPDGKIIKPTGKNVLIKHMPAGTHVFTHDQWKEKMMRNLENQGIMSYQSSFTAPTVNNSGLSKEDMRDVMVDAMGRIKTGKGVTVIRDERGYKVFLEEEFNKTEIQNGRFNIQGQDV